MINTLKGIEKLRHDHKITGKIFLIAGASHLREIKFCNQDGTIAEEYCPNENSLSTLYEELKTRKVVVLKSKFQDKEMFVNLADYKIDKLMPFNPRELVIDVEGINKKLSSLFNQDAVYQSKTKFAKCILL